jgi:hypothetical protein
LLGQAALGYIQRPACGADTALFHDGDESAQLVERHSVITDIFK